VADAQLLQEIPCLFTLSVFTVVYRTATTLNAWDCVQRWALVLVTLNLRVLLPEYLLAYLVTWKPLTKKRHFFWRNLRKPVRNMGSTETRDLIKVLNRLLFRWNADVMISVTYMYRRELYICYIFISLKGNKSRFLEGTLECRVDQIKHLLPKLHTNGRAGIVKLCQEHRKRAVTPVVSHRSRG
jgi:hypothetical protein